MPSLSILRAFWSGPKPARFAASSQSPGSPMNRTITAWSDNARSSHCSGNSPACNTAYRSTRMQPWRTTSEALVAKSPIPQHKLMAQGKPSPQTRAPAGVPTKMKGGGKVKGGRKC